MKKLMILAAAIFVAINCAWTTQANAKYLMFMPFKAGTKAYCVQGNDGSFTHTGKWEYAYDFTLGSESATFGASVYSPVNGTVVDARTGAPDYSCNSVSASCNNNGWGNSLLIKDDTTGLYVRFGHMKAGSVQLKVNDKVKMAQKIGTIGCSGLSTGAHLHVHVQETSAGDAQSVDFAFVEGDIAESQWYTSELALKVSVGDALGKSLSHELTQFGISKSSGWTYKVTTSSNRMTAGDSYSIKKLEDKEPWYKWIFRMKMTGVYALYTRATCVGSKNDPAVLYYLYSYDDDDIETELEIDQTECVENQWHFLLVTTFLQGDTYYLKLFPATDGMNSTADSLKFVRLYP